MKFSTFILAPLFAAPYVLAHGLVTASTIGGQDASTAIRKVTDQNPINNVGDPGTTCGRNAGPAAVVAAANPGDTITFNWRTASNGRWPHNIGPMLTYMASCGSVTCDKFNQADAQWFKIDQVGKDPSNNNLWVQNQLFEGGVASVQIPQNVAPGGYLVRHEIIALHLATNPGGAEFYAGCVQVNIGGNGNGVPRASDLVKIPGAYSANDPGIFAPNVFDNNAPYVFPGPQIATFVAGSVSPPSPSSSSSSSLPANPSLLPTDTLQPSLQPSPQPSPEPVKSKFCKKKKNSTSSSSDSSPAITLVAAGPPGSNPTPTPTPTPTPGTGYSDYRPRRLSHIMRRMGFERSFH